MATRTVTNEFAVLRYTADVPLHLRMHSATLGRYKDYDEAEHFRLLKENGADLQVEERSESWDEEVEDVELDQNTKSGDARDES
jgi:hypothetical protein